MYFSIQVRMSSLKALVTARMLRIMATPTMSAATVSVVRKRGTLRVPAAQLTSLHRRGESGACQSFTDTHADRTNKVPPSSKPNTARVCASPLARTGGWRTLYNRI